MNFTQTHTPKILEYPALRTAGVDWGRTALILRYQAQEGYIETSKGNKVTAFQLEQDTLSMTLYNIDTKTAVQKSPDFFEQFSFEIEYNCFGYCFANSQVFIPDPSQIIIDDYEKVNEEEAEIILFIEHAGVNDRGKDNFIYSHAVKILENGNVSFKPGLNPLIEDIAKKKAIHNYNFNHALFIRKTT